MTKSVPRGRSALAQTHLPILQHYYQTLLNAHGPQHWWPGRSRFEVIVGAILVQNTAWKNVEAAIRNLRHEKLLTPSAMHSFPESKLAALVRSSGYYRQKAKKLKAFTAFLYETYAGSLAKMFRIPTAVLREELLSIQGIGPETADSILLYAGGHAVFVVDAYTRRILERHSLAAKDHRYDEIRALFETSLPPDFQLFNEFHALIVQTGKQHCFKSTPDCNSCPLRSFLPDGASPVARHGLRESGS